MSGPVGYDVCFEWNANQGKVTNYIQQFMSGGFIRKTEIQVIKDAAFIYFYIFFFENLGYTF